mmetsp:Transcript_17581/g.15494  ORF Transcript_17581/g.15494 Transcript_17581/m.15494 type:complete len:207 (+) Transcript_17581:44-664(+)
MDPLCNSIQKNEKLALIIKSMMKCFRTSFQLFEYARKQKKKSSESPPALNQDEFTSQNLKLLSKKRVRPVWPRSRRTHFPDIDETLLKVYEKLEKFDYKFPARVKTSRGLHKGRSKRRSKYVGVSKSKLHFQALITVNKIKKYIGTYCTEKDAAMAYDFYALGLNGLTAKTNFEYTADKVKKMIEYYFNSNGLFDPSFFKDEVEQQ